MAIKVQKDFLDAMPKTHLHFYLHRIVKRRNSYIAFCYKHGRRPVQTNVKTPKPIVYSSYQFCIDLIIDSV